jgi:D-arginine dehydrogenase
MTHYDIVVAGAGMSGASLAAELAPHASVLILEAEAQPGYHATGRSAAFWHETYGGPGVQPLTSASGVWLRNPPAQYSDASFTSPRGSVTIASEADRPVLQAFVDQFARSDVVLEWRDREALEMRCDGLRAEWVVGLEEASCSDIDVAALHQAYLRVARQSGAELRCNVSLLSARPSEQGWQIETSAGDVSAGLLVNAAGAWVDEVATRAGVAGIGITPFRRTMVQIKVDRDVPRDMPLIVDVHGGFYFKSDGAGGLWLSPHDEIPSPPTDAAPEELDVAIAIDRFERAVNWRIVQVTHKWAGLRSFSPDRLPVYGFDKHQPSFFWFAGQGGFGIQTAPAAAMIGASLVLGKIADPLVSGIDVRRYAPERFT